VERALRDRTTFPLPPDVNLKELLSNSYFQGPDADDEFEKHCLSESVPLSESMIQLADRLYSNKFTDIKKHIHCHVLPKFHAIIKKLTGDGKRSG
jgi:hypothetical protein